MRRALLLVIISFFNYLLSAQELSDIGKIPLVVLMPSNVDVLDESNMLKLETKVAQIVTVSGLASAGYTPIFAIFPKFSIIEINEVEGGMQTLTAVTAEITLFIKQTDNNVVVSSMSKSLKGIGNSKIAAISNAISNISSTDIEYKNFIKISREKIISYYDDKCADLIALSENMVVKQNYEEALSVLMSIPIEAKACYELAQAKSNKVYKAYQNKICRTIILDAKTKIAAKQYNDALELLSQVDPLSMCSRDAKELIESTAIKVTDQQKKEWDLALKIYDDNIDMEKHRINAMKEIAIAVYKKSNHRLRRSVE